LQDEAMREILETLLAGEELSPEQTRESFRALMEGRWSEAQQAAFLVALRSKGETAREVAEAVRTLQEFAVSLPAPPSCLDTCGTGGDGQATLNLSTGAAIVAASLGVPVAKHGNRSVSSRCGSADVLEAMGWPLSLSPEACQKLLWQEGFAFLFAPAFHPAMKAVAPVRRALGVRTVFNLLGPLANPARVRRQLVGVFSPQAQELVAQALAHLGAEQAWVVHSQDGLDELSVAAPTTVVEVREGKVTGRFQVRPESLGLGLGPREALLGGDAQANAQRLWAILQGEEKGPAADAVALGAGAALLLGGKATSLQEGLARAQKALEEGQAAAYFRRLVAKVQELAHG
jgi:anthranilate phosphoribosyltransferase